MTKGLITTSIDTDVIEYHRKKGTPFSPVVNDYLRSLMGPQAENVDFDIRLNGLEADLAKTRLEKSKHEAGLKLEAKQELKEEFRSDIMALAVQYQEKDESRPKAEVFFKRFAEMLKKYDMQRAELIAYVEGRKVIPR